MVIIPAILETVSTRKDKTLRLVFGTNELDKETGSALLDMAGEFVFLALSKKEFNKKESDFLNDLKEITWPE